MFIGDFCVRGGYLFELDEFEKQSFSEELALQKKVSGLKTTVLILFSFSIFAFFWMNHLFYDSILFPMLIY